MRKLHPETLALHASWCRDTATHTVAVPIYQTTSFQFDDAGQASRLFARQELGNTPGNLSQALDAAGSGLRAAA